MSDLVSFLSSEVDALLTAGAEHIQFDEPCLQYSPRDLQLAAEALNAVIKGRKGNFWLCFYFGKISPLAAQLSRFKVQVIAADCVSHPENLDLLLHMSDGITPCFGLLDARNIKLEDEKDLQKKFGEISAVYRDAYISPSCGLEFLPHRNAVDKIKLLGRSVKDFNGVK